jgi:hypothetical protein
MTNPIQSPEVNYIYQLLSDFSFDTETYPAEAMIVDWLQQFEPIWISHAITEALYQGRYKLISVDQILQLWQRRGHPIRHFNREFESIILGQTLLCPSGYSDTRSPTVSSQLSASPPPAPTPPPAEGILPFQPSPPPEEMPPVDSSPSTFSQPWPSLESPSAASPDPIPNFRPVEAAPSPGATSEVIQPFVPTANSSPLHQRLKAVVQGGLQP